MRERIKDIDRLQHIAECIDNINSYLQGYTLDSMIADKKCFHAVVYNIMIIGEAAVFLCLFLSSVIFFVILCH